MQIQLQNLLKTVGVGVGVEIPQYNTGSNIEVAKLQTFNREVGKVSGFLIVYRLYIRMRIRDTTIENQIQWVLSYIQRGFTDIQKENILKDLEVEALEYTIVSEFLVDLKKEFRGEDNEMMKVAELKKMEQENRMIKKFV